MDKAGLGIGQREGVILEANIGRPIVINGGLFTIGNSRCAAARLLLAELLELQARRPGEPCRRSAQCG